MKLESSTRIYIVFGFLLLCAAVLIGRLFFVQIVHGNAYAQEADEQYITEAPNTFNRGSIFFKEKDGQLISAATLKTGYVIAINPTILADPRDAYAQIRQHIILEKEDFLKKAAKTTDPYEEIEERVPREKAVDIQELDIPGVSVHTQKWRYYPGEEMAAHTLGFVGFQGDERAGRYGVERYYNDVLDRSDEGLYVNFFAEVFSNITDAILSSEKNREGDIVLTVEPHVQKTLERTITQVHEQWDSRLTGGIIMDPRDGSIYALGITPGFNPNTFSQADPNTFAHPVVERVYEMGSIIKPLTMAAGLDSGAVTPETTYNDKGYAIYNGSRIENFDGKGRGVVDMQEVLSQSLNTGAAFVAEQMGPDSLRSYFYNYGLNQETGVELPNETRGLLDNLESPREIEYMTASFGQGIAMTPIETVRALAMLGNGGKLVDPHLVGRIDYTFGDTKKTYPNEGEQVISPQTSEEITRMLVKVVDEALAGGDVALPRYSVAAKTGTAQIADLENGGYYDDRFLHSFFGYFPAYDPQFIVFLYTVEPKEVRYASQTLTDPFMEITKFLLNYYEIPPDR